MKILVVGAGMYVTGRNGTGVGTIMASLFESSRHLSIRSITVASKSEVSRNDVSTAQKRINGLLGTNTKVRFEELGKDVKNGLEKLCRKEKYDLAILSIPDHLHFETAQIVLKSKIHCLIVKPLTPTVKEAKALIRIQTKNRLFAAVEFHKRYDETNLYIKKALQEKRLGKILYFTVDYSQRITIPLETFASWSHQTNIFQYLGVHYADLIHFLTGYLPKRLSAYGTSGILKSKGIDTNDSIHVQIIWRAPKGAGEFISTFNTNWIDPSNTSALSDQKYKVVGTLGRIECDQKNRGIELVTEQGGIQQINPYFSDYLPDENGRLRFTGYGHRSIEQFVMDVMNLQSKKISLEKLNRCRPSLKSSLVSTQIVEAVNRGLKEMNQWITI